MVFLNIFFGLIGLGIVVFIHELGHFLAARLVKIDVEAFSIGWGKAILKKKIGSVEYRLGMFPIGGYCKMREDGDYNESRENRKKGIKPEKGTYNAAHPLARILVSFAGPFFNLIFAIILFSVFWGIGHDVNTYGNRIILASEFTPGEVFPADAAGLMSGDRIVEIAGRNISYYHEIQENIILNANRSLPVIVERNGEFLPLNVTPSLDKSSGMGRIGVSFWIDPVVGEVTEESPAARVGLLPGDIFISANEEELRNSFDLSRILEEKPGSLTVEFERNGIRQQAEFYGEDLDGRLGITWAGRYNYRTPRLPVHRAIAVGIREGYKTVSVSIQSLRLLFMGIDLTQAVSGPVRITKMMGEAATEGFEQGAGIGFRRVIHFLALISIALGIMNLLPLPIIDGGMIILFLVELIRRKPASPKAVSVFQTCGIVIVGFLIFFALFNDILYLIRN